MQRANRSSRGQGLFSSRAFAIRTVLLAAMCGAALAGICPPATANIYPEVLFRFHVQDLPDTSFCRTNPVTSCSQIRRTSYASGTVEFDLFLEPYLEGLSMHAISAAIVWPAAWQVTGFEVCSGGEGTLHATPSGGQLEIVYPANPPLPDSLFLVARFVVEVSGEGAFNESRTEPSYAFVGPGPDYTRLYVSGIDAHAGVVCNVCNSICIYADYCHAEFLNALDLLEGADGSASGLFRVYFNESSGPGTCLDTWTTDQPWLEVTSASGMHPSPSSWNVWVRARSAGLPAGVYEGRVLGSAWEGECIGCGLVRFTVSQTSSVPDASGPRVDEVTWGEVKRRFR